MREFFIRGLEILVSVIIILMAIGILIAAGAASFGNMPMMGPGGVPIQGGPLMGLAILVGGSIYLLFVGGLMYLGLGIYQNTKRTADLLAQSLGR